MNDTDHAFADIATLGARLRSGELTPLDLTRACLARIERFDPSLNALRLITAERALAAATAAGVELAAGIDRGPLHGVPYLAKDLYDVAGLPTSAGSRVLESRIAARDCEVVARLTRAGMVLLGKTNTVQFAYGGAGINHDHGTPHNPWHEVAHLPGGSSSGSGVAVAAGLAPMGLGTDTGGSVRIPAALCGITGLKTTVGRVSRAGIYPLSWTLDSAGPLARTAADCAAVYAAIHGADPGDPSTAGRGPHDVLSTLDDGVQGLRVAFAEGALFEDTDPEVESAVRATGEVFAALGASVESVDFAPAAAARALNPRGLIIAAEAYTLNRELVDEHFDELDPIVAHRLVKGRDIAAHDYLRNMLDWHALRADTVAALRDIDVLLCPTVMIPPQPVAETDADDAVYADINLKCLRNTSIGNILDLCGLSVPCGFTTKGLPVGLMIYARPFAEDLVLRAGHAYQRATDWHRRTPDLAWTGA